MLLETGVGLPHTEIGKLQREITQKTLAGVLKDESELIEETRKAYFQVLGDAVNPAALDAAIISNLATLSTTAEVTGKELEELGIGPKNIDAFLTCLD